MFDRVVNTPSQMHQDVHQCIEKPQLNYRYLSLIDCIYHKSSEVIVHTVNDIKLWCYVYGLMIILHFWKEYLSDDHNKHFSPYLIL